MSNLSAPVPPTNMTVSYWDAEGERQIVVPAELVYVGVVDGSHRWDAVVPESVPLGPGLTVRCDILPAKTSIGVRVR